MPKLCSLLACLLLLVAMTSSSAAAPVELPPSLDWEQVAPGVWRAEVGQPDDFSFLSLRTEPMREESLAALGEQPPTLSLREVRGQARAGVASIRLPLGPEERLYGLGSQFKHLGLRGKVFHLRVDHAHLGGALPGSTHAPVPFYVSSRGYGVFIDSARRMSFYAGVGNRKDSPGNPPERDRTTDRAWQAVPTSDAVEASVQAPGFAVYVFAGPTPLDAVRRYNLFLGGGCLPPLWGLGFWHRLPTAATAAQVRSEVAEFEERRIPLDVIGLEPGWQSHAYPCSHAWDEGRFPDPAGLLEELADRGVRVNLWENPYVSQHSPYHERITKHTASHLVWLGEIPDLLLPQARKIIADWHAREHLDIGVSGYKIDEVDGFDQWLWPDHADFPSGTTAEQVRQTYGVQWQKLIYGLFEARNERTYGLVRASNAGANPLPFVLYNDNYDHREFLNAVGSCGISGVLWTPELRSARDHQEWVRRTQTTCLSPIAQLNGWASKTKPWSFPEGTDAVREAIALRMRLLPYLYSVFAEYYFEGTPPFRPVVLDDSWWKRPAGVGGAGDPERAQPQPLFAEVSDQYFLGPHLLIAPILAGTSERTVILPRGEWYDFHTGEALGGSRTIEVSPKLNEVPIFARAGRWCPCWRSPVCTQAPFLRTSCRWRSAATATPPVTSTSTRTMATVGASSEASTA
ncbi:MAG: TIM-barrel domain-containing protein [Phycisphaerales bacterium JB038]